MGKIKSQTNDPENYHKMSVPFESAEAANEALNNFYNELGELRKKHKIPDVLIVTKGSVKYEDGEIGDWMQHSFLGNSLNRLPMAAYVYGQVQADHKEIIAKMIAAK